MQVTTDWKFGYWLVGASAGISKPLLPFSSSRWLQNCIGDVFVVVVLIG